MVCNGMGGVCVIVCASVNDDDLRFMFYEQN